MLEFQALNSVRYARTFFGQFFVRCPKLCFSRTQKFQATFLLHFNERQSVTRTVCTFCSSNTYRSMVVQFIEYGESAFGDFCVRSPECKFRVRKKKRLQLPFLIYMKNVH